MDNFYFVLAMVFIAILSWFCGFVISRDIYKEEGAFEALEGNTIVVYRVHDNIKVDSCIIFK